MDGTAVRPHRAGTHRMGERFVDGQVRASDGVPVHRASYLSGVARERATQPLVGHFLCAGKEEREGRPPARTLSAAYQQGKDPGPYAAGNKKGKTPPHHPAREG